MSDLQAVRRRKESLLTAKRQIEDELQQLDIAEGVLLRLAGQLDDAAVTMSLTTDLEGRSAAEAARFVLAGARQDGMHYHDILAGAVRFGYRRGEDDPSPDSMRRALSKRDDLFEALGDGVFRLRSNA